MLMRSGERWHCINRSCRCEVLVESGSHAGGQSPRCACGGPMKRNYVPPVFKYLEFLCVEGSPELQQRSGDR